MDYSEFLTRKLHEGCDVGFEPKWIPKEAFPFQADLISWMCRKGRSAVFADCGLGKTLMQLTWAKNAFEKSGKRVLVSTPLAVAPQTVQEGRKFGIDCEQSRDGKSDAPITVTNYQQLDKFDSKDFGAVVCDESSILKNFDGALKSQITDFMRKVPYRLLCTATAAPNDYIELGTSSEALGELGFMDMLSRFFKKAEATTSRSDEFRSGVYRFRGHAKEFFWRWVCSWARALRKPSDIGHSDDGYVLPKLTVNDHVVSASTRRDGFLFDMPAITLEEQRDERRRTIQERCELAASLLANTGKPGIAWCHLNPEGKLLEKLIPGAVEVEGSDPDEFKEETFKAFVDGQIRVIVTKPTIAGFGLNFQHCAHQTFFVSHSFEQYYQSVRRSWRFGQRNPVTVDCIASEGERAVMSNLRRKAKSAEEMFEQLIAMMNNELIIARSNSKATKTEIPNWL